MVGSIYLMSWCLPIHVASKEPFFSLAASQFSLLQSNEHSKRGKVWGLQDRKVRVLGGRGRGDWVRERERGENLGFLHCWEIFAGDVPHFHAEILQGLPQSSWSWHPACQYIVSGVLFLMILRLKQLFAYQISLFFSCNSRWDILFPFLLFSSNGLRNSGKLLSYPISKVVTFIFSFCIVPFFQCCAKVWMSFVIFGQLFFKGFSSTCYWLKNISLGHNYGDWISKNVPDWCLTIGK